MELIDNISLPLGDDLKRSLKPGTRLKIAASCFSMFAYEALKEELGKIDSLEFIFTAPTFVPDEVTDKIRKECKDLPLADVLALDCVQKKLPILDETATYRAD